ncbi:MAG: tRNA (N(6)-L-threonylcarbamoyladenosine(37)-C(2))-methylthiotransferase MtaB [Saprospiraceae bacterium]|nr:tRNA (N(6)-L-threonylcarbamoyladenosine(37)-C(2))-methylthiotransferase MtaB [Saprospiraceae bacterium]
MATPRSVAFHTLGCKLNFAETSSITRLFEGAGYAIHNWEEPADFYVINTCSVTDFADRKCRKAVRHALRQSPHARVIMMGCYAQLKPQEIAEIPGVDLVLGAGEKFKVLDYIDQLRDTAGKGLVAVQDIQSITHFDQSFSFGDRTRSFLKVQDGCDYNCAFCTIPQARGKSRSESIDRIVANAEAIAEMGVKEVVLTGVNIGDFGKYLDPQTGRFRRQTNFLSLLQALDQIASIARIRISSIEPNLCDDAVIEFIARSRCIVPHLHLPLQSGNDKQLEKMQRRYRRDLYADRVAAIKHHMPHACIGVDVIVGFPGETDEDFLETYRFIQSLDIAYLHVFTYSERTNTPAYSMVDPVRMEVRRERNRQLTILSEKKRRAFYASFRGQVRPVLFEKSNKPGCMTGFTDNYLKVDLPLEGERLNTIFPVRLERLDDEGHFSGVQLPLPQLA